MIFMKQEFPQYIYKKMYTKYNRVTLKDKTLEATVHKSLSFFSFGN